MSFMDVSTMSEIASFAPHCEYARRFRGMAYKPLILRVRRSKCGDGAAVCGGSTKPRESASGGGAAVLRCSPPIPPMRFRAAGGAARCASDRVFVRHAD